MWELHFSRCTERWTWAVPYIGPKAAGADYSGPYYVEGPSRAEKIGEAATAAQAVGMVVERLPAQCAPAPHSSAPRGTC